MLEFMERWMTGGGIACAAPLLCNLSFNRHPGPDEFWLVKIIRTVGYFSRNWPAHPLNIRGGEAVHAEGVGDLAAVMYVVLDDVPDDPSAGVGVYLAFPLILDSRLQICERIASQHLLHDLPGFFQSAHQLIRGAWETPRPIPLMKSAEVLIALFQIIVEPPSPHRNHVTRQLID